MVISLYVIILPTTSLISLSDISTADHFLFCIVMNKLSPAFTTKVMRVSTYIHLNFYNYARLLQIFSKFLQ